MTGRGVRGPRVVVGLYLGIVAFAGVAGHVIVTSTPVEPVNVRLFFLVPLPDTAFGLAVFGAVTVGAVLGVPLALVALLSRRIHDPESG